MYKVYVQVTGRVLYESETDDNLEQRARQYADNNKVDVVLVKPSGATATFYYGKLAHDDARRLALFQNNINIAAAGGLTLRRR